MSEIEQILRFDPCEKDIETLPINTKEGIYWWNRNVIKS